MNVPFLDLKAQHDSIKGKLDSAINDTIKESNFIMGKRVEKFEKEFADFCGSKYAVGVNSGTDALLLALKSAGIKREDEIITVPNTFIATAESILMLGCKIKFVDIDKNSYNINVDNIKNAISEKTKAIMPVHLYGQPADMKPIIEIAEKYNLKIIEDACQAHGAEYKNKKVPVSNIGCFSFYPGKNLGALGDGGIIVTNEKDLAEKAMKLRDHGKISKYEHALLGYNSRLDALQAAILSVKLKYLEKWNEKRRKNAKIYNGLLEGVITPIEADYAKHVYHLYVIRAKKRDQLQEYLNKNGISTIIHYPIPLHKQPALKQYSSQSCPITEEHTKEILSLPMFPELTEGQIQYIAKKIKEFFK